MRKYVSVFLGCFFVAFILIPGAYSAWQKELHVSGMVQITKEKQNRGKMGTELVMPLNNVDNEIIAEGGPSEGPDAVVGDNKANIPNEIVTEEGYSVDDTDEEPETCEEPKTSEEAVTKDETNEKTQE